MQVCHGCPHHPGPGGQPTQQVSSLICTIMKIYIYLQDMSLQNWHALAIKIIAMTEDTTECIDPLTFWTNTLYYPIILNIMYIRQLTTCMSVVMLRNELWYPLGGRSSMCYRCLMTVTENSDRLLTSKHW